jgi:hypothetical protein
MTISASSFENCLFSPFAHVLIGLLVLPKSYIMKKTGKPHLELKLIEYSINKSGDQIASC